MAVSLLRFAFGHGAAAAATNARAPTWKFPPVSLTLNGLPPPLVASARDDRGRDRWRRGEPNDEPVVGPARRGARRRFRGARGLADREAEDCLRLGRAEL